MSGCIQVAPIIFTDMHISTHDRITLQYITPVNPRLICHFPDLSLVSWKKYFGLIGRIFCKPVWGSCFEDSTLKVPVNIYLSSLARRSHKVVRMKSEESTNESEGSFTTDQSQAWKSLSSFSSQCRIIKPREQLRKPHNRSGAVDYFW